MHKRTITKWWIWGLGIQVAGVILSTVMALVMAAHIVDLTTGNRDFVPDSFFWTTIGLMILGGIVFCGGSIVQLVAQIGAIFNTHRLENKTWFHVLLSSAIAGNVVLFITLGLQFGLGSSGSGAAGFVWPGYVVGGLIGLVSMLCYLVAGPDSLESQLSKSGAEVAGAEGLAQA